MLGDVILVIEKLYKVIFFINFFVGKKRDNFSNIKKCKIYFFYRYCKDYYFFF